jgi:hypothetical protein
LVSGVLRRAKSFESGRATWCLARYEEAQMAERISSQTTVQRNAGKRVRNENSLRSRNWRQELTAAGGKYCRDSRPRPRYSPPLW